MNKNGTNTKILQLLSKEETREEKEKRSHALSYRSLDNSEHLCRAILFLFFFSIFQSIFLPAFFFFFFFLQFLTN